MKFLRKFNEHTSYEAELNRGGIVNISLPNVSYCEDVKDVHFNPYNLIEFYVGEITPAQTVKIYTDVETSIDVTVSEDNKWYRYLLPKDKGLFRIEGDSVKKVIIKADINTNDGITIIPYSIVDASFKGSNTSNVTNMRDMFFTLPNITSLDVSSFNTSKVTNMSGTFQGCSGITSLDVSNFDTSKVTSMDDMFSYCPKLTSLDLRSFDTRNVTSMYHMFQNCSSLETLDLSGWNTINVTSIDGMFSGCSSLNTITMVGCEQPTIDKIKAQLTKDGISLDNVSIVTE